MTLEKFDSSSKVMSIPKPRMEFKKTHMEIKTKLSIELPVRLKIAAEDEAARRGINLSALVKNYLSIFLPKNLDKSRNELDIFAKQMESKCTK